MYVITEIPPHVQLLATEPQAGHFPLKIRTGELFNSLALF